MTKLLNCYNRGCGASFDPNNNLEESCTYHPGVPFFHDAYKGWTCCNKKSVDFTEFLNIKGCTKAKHSNEKPIEPEKPETEEVAIEEEPQKIPAPIAKSTLVRPPFESPLTQIEAFVNPSFKKQIDELPHQQIARPKQVQDAGEIQVGTICKNGGCNYAFEKSESDMTPCVHHPGVPIFHEGLKFWSCCQKRTSDFTAFMNQVGCESGIHKWTSAEDEAKTIKCRWDWHQTATNVVVTVYAKMYDYKTSFVKVNPVRLMVSLMFPQQDNNEFGIDLELRGIIKEEETKVQMFGTKVEINLIKAEPGTWTKLDFPRTTNVDKSKEELEPIKQEEKEEPDSDGSDVDLDDISPFRGAQITEIRNE